jgi:hypothetical protein
MTQDTGKFRNTKDQFYTKETVAKKCIDKIIETIPESTNYLWIEPSAGNGAFFNNIHFTKIGMDIEPHGSNIEKDDYLTWKLKTDKDADIIVFGNPPFGRQSSLAKSFISKSCQFAKVIAFILPRSFTKPSMYNSFHLRYHLVYSVELEENAFLLNGQPYHVHCVFQIWEKRDNDRPIDKKIKTIGFEYVREEKYDIAFRRVGVNAGKCYVYGEKRSIQSHYFIKFDKKIDIGIIVEKINCHVFPTNTVGPRSLSKGEVNQVLNDIIKESSV